MPHDLYKQGTRDIAIFRDNLKDRNGNLIRDQRWNISKMNNWIQKDTKETKVNFGKEYVRFLTKKLSIPVDKNIIFENGTLNEVDSNLVLNSLNWNLNIDQLEKRHMMIIDLIDNNKWERPIYFSITIGNSANSYSYL